MKDRPRLVGSDAHASSSGRSALSHTRNTWSSHDIPCMVGVAPCILGHALHEKGSQRQIGVGTLVSSQERRALADPLINRGLTAGQPRVNRWFRSSIGLNRISFVRASEETSRTVSSIRWRARGRVVSWPDRPDGVPSYPAPAPFAAPPCAAPTRPARCVRVLDSTNEERYQIQDSVSMTNDTWHTIHHARHMMHDACHVICRIQNPDIPRAVRVGAPGGTAGRGREGLDANRTVRLGSTRSSYPPRHRRQVAWTNLQKHESAKFNLNRMRKQKQQLKTGTSAIHPRFVCGTRTAFCIWLLTSGPAPAQFCLCKKTSCKTCPGTRYIKHGICTLFLYHSI